MIRSRPLLALATALTLVSCGDAVAPFDPVPTAIEVGAAAVSLDAIGAWASLTVVVRDQEGGAILGAPLTFASDLPAVASVSAEGVVTAVGNGSATVTVTSGTAQGTVVVTVAQVATTLSAQSDTVSFQDPGETETIAVAAADALGADAGSLVSWGSLDPSVAVVDSTGLVTAVETGTTLVVATAGTTADSIVVRVAPELTIVAVGPTTVTDTVQAFVTLAGRVEDLVGSAWSGGQVSWSVGAGSGAIVSAQEVESDITGHIGAVWQLGTGAGTQRAFVQIESRGQTTALEFLAGVGAGAAVSSALVADSVLLSAVGESAFLAPTYEDAWGNAATSVGVVWTSSDPSVASVAADGLVVGTGAGQATIVPALGGVGDSILISVVPRGAVSITFDDGWLSVYDNAWPLMQEFDLPANVGVYVDAAQGFPAYMNETQLNELHAAGWSMASHTLSHSDLTTLTEAQLDFELRESKAWLDARGYRGTNVLIAPYHQFEAREKIAASQYYVAARGAAANETTPDTLVAWRPPNPYELTGIDVDQLPYTTAEGREILRDMLQRTADEGRFLDVLFHQIPAGNVAAMRATLEIIEEFRERVLPYHELFPIFARTVN
ncbi:MAG: Ig-like domain-containing protein [Gemmatimonadota bacterium]